MDKALNLSVCRNLLTNLLNLAKGELTRHNNALGTEAVPEIAGSIVRIVGLG